MSRMADVSVAIQEWVATALQTQEVADALGVPVSGVLARVWDSTPPNDASLPYVDVVVAGPRDLGGVGLTEVMATAEVTVKAVGRTEAYEPLQPLARAIHHALHGCTNVPVSGGGLVLSSRRLRSVAYPEQAQGIEYRHLGGTYEVYAQ